MEKSKKKKNVTILVFAISLIVIFIVGMVFCLMMFPPNFMYPFDGKGTKENPFIIETKDDLIDFSKMSKWNKSDNKGKYFKLISDIDLGGEEWIPVAYKTREFGGNFDGGGHTINNFTIKTVGENIGFFAYTKDAFVDSGIFNLSLTNVTLMSNVSVNNIGILVGYSGSKIANCYVDAQIEIDGTPMNVGTIAATAMAEVLNCESTGSMTINASERIMDTKKQWSNIGGLVGSAKGDIIGSVNRMYINMTRIESNLEINRFIHVGGICGSSDGLTYSRLSNFADIRAVGALGGIIGTINNQDTILESCANYGELYSTSDTLLDIGGIAARSYTSGRPIIINSYNEGNIELNSILNSKNDGLINIFSCWAGGILAAGTVNVSNSMSIGDINVYGDATHYVGGLIGGINGTLKNSYHIGNISVISEKSSVIAGGVAGVVQTNANVSVVSCYSVGFVHIKVDPASNGNYLTGGIIGYNMQEKNSIQYNYYDIDIVNSATIPVGFISSLYWYGEEMLGEAENIEALSIIGNIGLNTADLQAETLLGFITYSDGFDENAVWIFEVGKYPRLYWEN